MNTRRLSIILGLAGMLVLNSCKPDHIDPVALSEVVEDNVKLSEYIARMQHAIRQGGKIDDTLEGQIRTLQHQLAEDTRELTKIKESNTQSKIRMFELEERLRVFEIDFRSMQQEALKGSNSPA